MTAWIGTVDEGAAKGRLKEVYEETRAKRGNVANIYKAQGGNPAALATHREMYLAIFYKESGLTRREREMIATAVSRANGSEYCIAHHADALGRHSTEPGLPALVATDYTKAPLTAPERALLDHAMKLAVTPAKVTRADVDGLKKHGYSEEAILDATHVTAYTSFLTRVALGLGVSHEDVEKTYRY